MLGLKAPPDMGMMRRRRRTPVTGRAHANPGAALTRLFTSLSPNRPSLWGLWSVTMNVPVVVTT